MNKRFLLMVIPVLTGALMGQDAARGHWTGSIDIPSHTLAVEVDLDKKDAAWIGSIAIPEQHAEGVPLEAIAFAGGKWSFRVKGAPGEPTFKGTIAEDGKTMAGDFAQGPGTFPFKLTRSGDAKVAEIKQSPAVAKEFVGEWEGTLEAGMSLHLILKLSNDDKGANGTLVSVDQGGAEIPVTTIEQKDTKLTLLVNAVGGEYHAEINKDGTELNGTWSQNGNQLPLALKKKVAEAPAKP